MQVRARTRARSVRAPVAEVAAVLVQHRVVLQDAEAVARHLRTRTPLSAAPGSCAQRAQHAPAGI
jgi:hypothetical protein